MLKSHLHATHPAITNRLKRAKGHLGSIIAMIEEGRPCADIAQQMQAVEKAIIQAKRTLIHDHLDHCLDDAENGENEDRGHTLSEFRQIAKYL